MKILITGGAGFIGSHTAELCLREGHEVRIVDDFSTGRLSNLAAVKNEIDLIEAEIQDYDALAAACHDIEAVIHLAAIASVVESVTNPLRTNEVNVTGCLNVLEAARRAATVRKVVFASSAAVYGNSPRLPSRETDPIEPHSPYAFHKFSGEFHGNWYSRQFGLDFSALRFFNVYGPRQDPASPYSGVLSIFAERALSGKTLTIHGDGLQTRDFINVSDVARIVLFAADTPDSLPPVMNVGTGLETSIADIAGVMVKEGGGQAEISHDAVRDGDVRNSCADISLLEGIYGPPASISMKSGIAELLQFILTDRPAK